MSSRILVTGDKGFIGGKVKKLLEEKGYEVHGWDKEQGDLSDVSVEVELAHQIDLADYVFHIAAQADLTTMYHIDGADSGFRDNVVAVNQIVNLCASFDTHLIYASTVCVYGNQEKHPETEDTTLPNPSEMYACTKYAAEWIVKGYGYNFGMPWTILRFATIYGPKQREAMGMHIFIKQALQGKDITVHGDGEQDRTLTHVDDLVRGIVSVIDKPKAVGEVINLTNTEIISANKMAIDIKDATGSLSKIVHVEQRPNQTMHEDFSTQKAKEILGWECKIPWLEGLKESIKYIKENEL